MTNNDTERAMLKPPVRKFPPLIRMTEVEMREVKWLWYPYIPIGKATMIYGQGGIGKSHITMDIAARITTGAPFPGQSETRPPANVLILNAEDDYNDTLKPRLYRQGADMDRIFIPKDEFFVLDAIGIKQLEEWMRQMAATIVFIDPVAFYLGGKVDINRMNEVRSFTGALSKAARNTSSAVVIVHHTKKGDSDDYNRAAGSVDFPNAMRSTLLVTRTNDGTRVMRQPKNNNAPEGQALAFRFSDDKFEWIGEYDDVDKLVAIGGARLNAATLIKDLLKDGPVLAKQMEWEANAAGINFRTLGRAKAGLAESYAKRVDGTLVWFWRLIGDKRQPKEDFLNANASVSSVEERATPSDKRRRPKAKNNSAVDPGAGEDFDIDGPVVATERQSRAGGSGPDPLSRSLGVGSKFKGEVAAILAAKGRLS